MALDATMKAKIYQLYGIPQVGSGYMVSALATLYGPAAEAYDFLAVKTELDSILTAAAADAETTARVSAQIADLDIIGFTNPMKIHKTSSGTEGTIIDYDVQRERIRQEISKILGFSAPKGGFLRQAPEQDNYGRIIR